MLHFDCNFVALHNDLIAGFERCQTSHSYAQIPLNILEITNDDYMEEDEEPWGAPIEDEPPLVGPPAGFDMNSASLVEQNPDYMNNLINSQIEYEGEWCFVLDGQIYAVPYEIEIDDDHVRRDIKNNWENVEWVGSIFGEYVAWY